MYLNSIIKVYLTNTKYSITNYNKIIAFVLFITFTDNIKYITNQK